MISRQLWLNTKKHFNSVRMNLTLHNFRIFLSSFTSSMTSWTFLLKLGSRRLKNQLFILIWRSALKIKRHTGNTQSSKRRSTRLRIRERIEKPKWLPKRKKKETSLKLSSSFSIILFWLKISLLNLDLLNFIDFQSFNSNLRNVQLNSLLFIR